jgi:monomeric sarcosine oxidase
MRHFDVIVIGTGGMGSAAALHLARRGVRVCGLDRFPPGHDRGSSHGQTRLIRLAYYEHPDYVPLLRRAYELWRDLETAAGRPLLVESGLLLAGPPESAVVRGTVESAEVHALPLERLDHAEAARRWPQVRLPDGWSVVHEPRGGYLMVEDCVRAHAAAAAQAGAVLEAGRTVLGWRATPGGGAVVETDAGDYAADRLVVAAGSWAADLARLPEVPLRVLRKSLFWYEPAVAARAKHAAGRLPCFGFDGPEGFFYGFPALAGAGLKIAEHTGGTPVADPLAVDRGVVAAERARVEAVLTARLPGVGTQLAAHAACLYTMSPDGHFLVGLHPHHPQVVVAAGFSGHGFKFAAVMGEILADLATAGRSSLPIGFLAPTRFGE